jgi:hypothetical protein
MRTVRSLMNAANPVPAPPVVDLPPRAEGELAELVGIRPQDEARPLPRRVLVPALALGGVVVLAAIAAVLVLRDPAPTQVDEPYYETTAELEGAAGQIVRATIRSLQNSEAGGFSETVATATVDAVAKGSPGAEVEFAYTPPGSGPEAPTAFTIGSSYVVLLVVEPGPPAHLVNSTQGWYTIEDGRAVPGAVNKVALSPATKRALEVR